MDPVSLGVLAALFVGLLVIVIAAWVIRAWVRSMVRMAKLAIWGGLSLLFIGAIAAAGVWFVYGEQIRALLAG